MAGLQARLDTAFGSLGDVPGNGNPPWRPAQQNIFRSGVENDNNSSEEDEYTERLRREVVSGMAMDLAEEDAPNEEGFMPSAAFCRRLDDEEELDGVDTTAAFSSEEYRPAPGTEVLEGNIYDQRFYSLEGRSPMEEEEDHNNEQQQERQPSPQKSRLIALSSRGPSKSNLRTSSSRHTTMKKRVSFTGIPEPPIPWVPPHKRGNFVSKFQQGTTLPPSPATTPPKNKQKFLATSNAVAAAPETDAEVKYTVPDYVANPQRYTRYEFDEPILVGGGVGQLQRENEAEKIHQGAGAVVQDAVAVTESQFLDPAALLEERENIEEEEEEERWQGVVGGGIQFRPRGGSGGGGSSGSGSGRVTTQQQVPLPVKVSFSEYYEEELEDAS